MDGAPLSQHASLSQKSPIEASQNRLQKIPDIIDEDGELQQALAASMENMKCPIEPTPEEKAKVANVNKEEETCSKKRPTYPPLPEVEPNGDRSLLCRVRFRLPDGRRVQPNFLREDPIQVANPLCLIPHI